MRLANRQQHRSARIALPSLSRLAWEMLIQLGYQHDGPFKTFKVSETEQQHTPGANLAGICH
jgi:hypothetical protein